MIPLSGFIGGGYTLKSVNVDCQRCVNLYPEMDEMGTAKNNEIGSLVSTPGLTRLSTVTSAPCRGLWAATDVGRAFGVWGASFYEITDPTNPTFIATIDTSTGIVGMVDNGLQLAIADGVQIYIFDFATSGGTLPVLPFTEGPSNLDFVDGYFIANRNSTGEFFLSGLYDGNTWNGLDFATAEGWPDDVLSLKVTQRELFLFGQETTEVWFNAGGDTFPFSRREFIEHGISSPSAIGKIDNSVLWWSQDKNGGAMAVRANPYTPTRVSTHAIEQLVDSYGDVADATSWTYSQNGHSFWATNFTGANTTLVLDLSTGLWHERISMRNGVESRHRAHFHCLHNGQHLFGDYENGKLYKLDRTAYMDDTDYIPRYRRMPHLANRGARLFYPAAQLDMETGVGLASGQGSDPQAMLRYSSDGGHSWSNEKYASIGKLGEYKKRARWTKLGCDRDRVWEVRVTDPVPVTLISFLIDPQPGAH